MQPCRDRSFALFVECKKSHTPKRRRSVTSSGENPPTPGSTPTSSTNATTPKSHGTIPSTGTTPGRYTGPLSERQQMALLMQMTAEESHQQAGLFITFEKNIYTGTFTFPHNLVIINRLILRICLYPS